MSDNLREDILNAVSQSEHERTYRALDGIIREELRSTIEGLKRRKRMIREQMRRETDVRELFRLRSDLSYLASITLDLEYIYNLCIEVSK